MLEFYKQSLLLFITLLILSVALALLCYIGTFTRQPLLPKDSSTLPWTIETINDEKKGGTSSITINNSNYRLEYDYVINKTIDYPFVSVILAFDELNSAEKYIDISQYSSASFFVKCNANNLLSMVIHSVYPGVTLIEDFSSYRISQSLFSCNNDWNKVEIDLSSLIVPEWWLTDYQLKISDQDYRLDKVIALSFTASGSGPVGQIASVQLSELKLTGRDFGVIWIFAPVLSITWLVFFIYLFRRYTLALVKDVKDKLHDDRPLVAFTHLSNEYLEGSEKNKILRFMATEYANPDLNLDYAVSTLGVSHTKFNALLKDVYGLTFVAYLNKIRLSEAARLIRENKDVSVSEIVHAVGYKNISYFNQLFKKEYGCTPVKFRKLYVTSR